MKRLIIYIILFGFIVACNNQKRNFIKIVELDKSIDNYISLNPPSYVVGLSSSYPSYQVYFYEKEGDTMMSIKQTPYLINIEQELIRRNENDIEYKLLEPDGVLWYKNKFPLIITNSKNYIRFSNGAGLIKEIPDSLKFNKEGVLKRHEKWVYRIQNGKFERE